MLDDKRKSIVSCFKLAFNENLLTVKINNYETLL